MSESDSDEENVIRYGTPLEPFEEDEIPSKRKYQQQPDQYAVDDHGRRRFHGAFTGGFSAGFGNTVGTPEGWTPSTFKSSRSEKANMSNQRPEDFMDDEDRSEFGIAPRHMQTHSEFSGQKRPRQQRFHDGPIPGEPVLEQYIRAVHETAAVKMLKRMGWREGQGVGDRVSKREKKRAQDQHKVYGCYMPPEMRQESKPQSDEDSTDSEFEYDTLFAPDDYEPYIIQRKNDRFGLGYSGLSRHSVLGNLVGEYGSGDARSHLMMKEKGKKVSIRGQAFGVGAFEADDEDIYATEDMSHYDFALGGDKDKPKPKKTGERGVNVLEGFVKASEPLPPVPSYPPPALPRGYTPAPAGSKKTRFDASNAPQRDQGLGRHELTSEARGAMLGEKPLPKILEPEPVKPQSVQKDLTTILGKNINFVSTNTEKEKELDFIPITESSSDNKSNINVFKPFASDPKKQARYEKYVDNKDSVLERDGNMDRLSEWERNREMAEFEQAAKLYKPLTGIMGDRFTHASQPDDAVNPLTAVARSSMNYGLATPEQVEAAKIGAYGTMTRKQTTWRPEALVCKRFNVPELGAGRMEPKKEDKPKVSYSIFSYLESSVHNKESFTKEQSKFSGSKSLNIEPKPIVNEKRNEATTSQVNTNAISSEVNTNFNKRMTVAELFLKESEKDLQNKNKEIETETIEKFDKMDLYKSIFLSDSEDDEMNSDNKNSESTDANEFIDKPKNVERNLSPPRGIFANIDFDELNSWKRKPDATKESIQTENRDTVAKPIAKELTIENKDQGETMQGNEEKVTNNIEATYGPKIPEALKQRLETEVFQEKDNFRPVFRRKDERIHEIESSSSSDSWVEAKEVKSKKLKKKKSKKHKSKHKKSKHKKKDR